MKSNADKCNLLVNTNNKLNMRIGKIDICNSEFEKLLGAKFNHKLTFDDHISKLCKKASRTILALVRVTPYICIYQKGLFIGSLFSHMVMLQLS